MRQRGHFYREFILLLIAGGDDQERSHRGAPVGWGTLCGEDLHIMEGEGKRVGSREGQGTRGGQKDGGGKRRK